MKTMLNMLWEEAENKKDKYKIWSKIYNWLNKDNLGNIVLDNDVFWFEKTCSLATFPNYIYNYLVKWGERKGYTYLSNIKEA